MTILTSDKSSYYDFIKPLLMDEESRRMFRVPARYTFTVFSEAGKQGYLVPQEII